MKTNGFFSFQYLRDNGWAQCVSEPDVEVRQV